MLRTNVELDEKLVDEAMRLIDKKTKQELVSAIKRKKILELEDKVEWTGDLTEMRKDRI